ncbi:MAG: universal stress protein, partial [bacterium]|nr:universal stress protein [bacterium]
MVRQRRSTWTVAPQGETGVLVRGAGPVCIPLGDGESGSWASLLGIPIARALGLSVVFYHTTWRNPAVASDEARAHMDPDAQLVLATAHQRAVAAGVAYHTIVEMADGVAEGIVRAALRERCSLIITARGRATGRGSYVDQLLAESPIPVWSAPRKETP